MSKKIFFVTPIGNEGSKERKTSDFVLKSIIKPVAEKLEYEALRSDLINSSNSITDDMINQLKTSDLVIADVTGSNPNVMFEVGFRFSLGTPMILISQSIKDLPFDIHGLRTMAYEQEAPDIENLQNKLTSMIDVFEQSENSSNKFNDDNYAEKLGQQMALEAISSGDFSAIENVAKLAKQFGLDK
ncbi:Nucleoside 2-deoxyribosyltransferase (RCL) [Fructobacillus tropaeoli]|uniref:hypothetical protein n=1 Tax=Fructobacillus tropaeoli TaxID=709323 RepID=UPI002DB363D6|nr:Nucleoside 2-deoxyribosyltransferase (RCL) [Fructobacillus tropaeoli]